jgi:hypothetical protein
MSDPHDPTKFETLVRSMDPKSTDPQRWRLPSGHGAASLPLLFLQSWFNDQVACFEIFLRTIPQGLDESWWESSDNLDAIKDHYRSLSNRISETATDDGGEHKRPGQLTFPAFAWWATRASRAAIQAGSLTSLVERAACVEDAHTLFKPWFVPGGKVRAPRILNAADAARLLSESGYLRPEERPLLARGALRGAALLEGKRPPSIQSAEGMYPNEGTRTALEERMAAYARDRWGVDVPLARFENELCEVLHKGMRGSNRRSWRLGAPVCLASRTVRVP